MQRRDHIGVWPYEVLNVVDIDPMEAIPYNRAFERPNSRPEERASFFELLEKKGFDGAVKQLNSRYYRNITIKKILKKILPNGVYKNLINKG